MNDTPIDSKTALSVIAFGIARDIFGHNSLNIEWSDGLSIGRLKQLLTESYPDLQKLRSLQFAVNEEYQSDDYILSPGEEVVIIPPVSGG